MSVENPYQAPVAQNDLVVSINADYRQLDEKAFNKLYYRSSNITAIAALVLLGSIFMGVAAAVSWSGENELGEALVFGGVMFSVMFLVQAVSFIGLASRSAWGRIMGFVSCAFMLINIPIGTLIGIVGIVALAKAPELFGPDRVTHKELKAEFKLRKQQKKEAKRAAKLAKKAA